VGLLCVSFVQVATWLGYLIVALRRHLLCVPLLRRRVRQV